MKPTDRTFKESVRRICMQNGIYAVEIVEGTCLSEAQVASVFNPNNEKAVSLSSAVAVATFLQKRTGGLVTVDYLIGAQPTQDYHDFASRAHKHLKERAAGLSYYEENLQRLKEEQVELCDYLQGILNKLKPLQ